LHAALDEVEGRTGPLALVLTGTGKFFSNGFDLDWLVAHPDQARAFLDEMFRAYARILRLDAPTVAAVNGHAFGAGAMLATVFDHAVMREDRGYWCMPEVDLGVPIDERILSLLASRLPRRSLTTALVTAHRYPGPEAVAAGFVDEVAPLEEVLSRAVDRAGSRAGQNREIIGIHKRLLHRETLSIMDPTST
jgi:enoyl-CoA hydratase/carnithine racemase